MTSSVTNLVKAFALIALGLVIAAISPASIDTIDWAGQSVTMNLTRDEIRNRPTLDEANVPSHELTRRFVIL